jgi:hypothetical protein
VDTDVIDDAGSHAAESLDRVGYGLPSIASEYVVLLGSGIDIGNVASNPVIAAAVWPPWWTGRVVGAQDEPGSRTAGGGGRNVPVGVVFSVIKSLVNVPLNILLGRHPESDHPHRPEASLRVLEVDFGEGVVSAVGGLPSAWSYPLRWEDIATNVVSFAPSDVAIGEPAVLEDDAEWDDSEAPTRWVSLKAESYRGGGVMNRRGPTVTSE